MSAIDTMKPMDILCAALSYDREEREWAKAAARRRGWRIGRSRTGYSAYLWDRNGDVIAAV